MTFNFLDFLGAVIQRLTNTLIPVIMEIITTMTMTITTMTITTMTIMTMTIMTMTITTMIITDIRFLKVENA